MADLVDIEAMMSARMEELRPAHEEYLRLERMLRSPAPSRSPSGVSRVVLEALLELGPGSPRDVHSYLAQRDDDGPSLESVSNALSYMARSGRVARHGRGRYEAVDG